MNPLPDDPFNDLEARLRAWRPAALPRALHARLLAAGPPPVRRTATRRTLLAAGALALALGGGWWLEGRPLSAPASPAVARRAASGRFVEAAWTPGASLTMNLATGTPVDKLPAPWCLDNDAGAAGGLFAMRSADGKLLLKVNCQF